MFDPHAIADFARYYGFHYEVCDPHTLVREVLIDMERGLKGQPSSLPMIPSYLTPIQSVAPGKTVIALDAGGTNFRAALIHFDSEARAVIEHIEKVPMPGTQGQLNEEQFFNQIADLIVQLLELRSSVEGIGFCFSYPTEITEEADGIVLALSKEVNVPDVIGKPVIKGVRQALARRRIKAPDRIALLNDTVATLFTGLIEMGDMGNGPMVGAILGTGYNTAYPEYSIPKIKAETFENPCIVVCETGNFAHRYQGYLDREFDRTTKNPGTYLLEKASSGAYLGPLFFVVAKQALYDGILQFNKSAEFTAWKQLYTKDLNEFLRYPVNPPAQNPFSGLFAPEESDARNTFTYLASLLTERGALLAAAPIAAAIKRIDHYDTANPVRVAIEGTTYLIYKGMRSALDSWLHIMVNNEKPLPYFIAPVDQASLLGAAAAALTR
ncbi:MAG: hexokinase [Treponema sp.]|jgi:hexokinase|nr:hexokinase [Treponema sp.]